jgi:hypothetical protein
MIVKVICNDSSCANYSLEYNMLVSNEEEANNVMCGGCKVILTPISITPSETLPPDPGL